MIRILFFVFIGFLVWLLVRVLGRDGRQRDARSTPDASAPPAAVLQCAWCGVHVPDTEVASLPDGRSYCSDAHRQAALAAAPDRAPS